MKKALFIGLVAQVAIYVAAVVMEDWHVLVAGNYPVIGLGMLAGTASMRSGGWEFVGTSKKEKDEIYTLRSKVIWKWFLFMLPGILVVLAYFLKYGSLMPQYAAG
ncbi:hypothetical protein J0B03_07210 [Alkalibacter rhizosphaerae]|uniref:Uncharacterized protein n=1 Tax=Alkalibacter rhizosphaerae TaxID=2815577 RepID=A0A975AGK1_9FIRM|nr:hypothetical protein [Alkalibacter rhizosphaerae]QSX07624.1 hypothetical protein J0B03_07210 [Alkalibacter rhizosphaerae]